MSNINIKLVTKKDIQISYFAGSGPGGQKKNKVKSGVQIKHTESGAIGRASDSRLLEENKRNAFLRMYKTPKFKVWLSKKMAEIRMGQTIEEKVEEELNDPRQTVYMVRDEENGGWKEVDKNYFKNTELNQSI